jgi:hypothetical protein
MVPTSRLDGAGFESWWYRRYHQDELRGVRRSREAGAGPGGHERGGVGQVRAQPLVVAAGQITTRGRGAEQRRPVTRPGRQLGGLGQRGVGGTLP